MTDSHDLDTDPAASATNDLVQRIRWVNALLAHYALAVEGGESLSARHHERLIHAVGELVEAITQQDREAL